MSFRDELASRRARKAQMAEQETRERNAQVAKIRSRAAEVAHHLTHQGADVGLVVENQNGRVTLSHPKLKEQITIDSDIARYTLIKNVVRVSGPKTVPNTQQSVETLDEIDSYVLDWLEGIGAS
jgi:hypothetical protein